MKGCKFATDELASSYAKICVLDATNLAVMGSELHFLFWYCISGLKYPWVQSPSPPVNRVSRFASVDVIRARRRWITLWGAKYHPVDELRPLFTPVAVSALPRSP
jgi:hypothetical protein